MFATCPKCGHTIDTGRAFVALVTQGDGWRIRPGSLVLCIECNVFLVVTDGGRARVSTAHDRASLEPNVRAAVLRINQWSGFTPEDEAQHWASLVRGVLKAERCSVLLDFIGCGLLERSLSEHRLYRCEGGKPMCPRCFEEVAPFLSLMGRKPDFEGYPVTICKTCASIVVLAPHKIWGPLDIDLLELPPTLKPIVAAVRDAVKSSFG